MLPACQCLSSAISTSRSLVCQPRSLRVAADDLVALDERAVAYDGLPIPLEAHHGRGVRGLELIAGAEPGGIFGELAAHVGVLRAARFFAHLLPGLLLFARPAKQKNILHGYFLQMLAYLRQIGMIAHRERPGPAISYYSRQTEMPKIDTGQIGCVGSVGLRLQM